MGRLDLTQSRLKELLHYAPDTGIFTWVSRHGNSVAGRQAGWKSGKYILIGVDGHQHGAHRLAWLYMTGSFPPAGLDIDHINRLPNDNSWENLRTATRAQNSANSPKRRKNSASAWKGVDWRKSVSKWRARIRVNGKMLNIGEYSCEREAAEAYIFAAIEHHGEYARFE